MLPSNSLFIEIHLIEYSSNQSKLNFNIFFLFISDIENKIKQC